MEADLIYTFIVHAFKDLSASKILEGIILLTILWKKLAPHLKKIEERLAGLETALNTGFKSGEIRFTNIETRLTTLETGGNGNGNNQQTIVARGEC